MSEFGPTCDRCGSELGWHGHTLVGQACDLNLEISDFWRAVIIGLLGERRGWRLWWQLYDRRSIR